MLKTSYHILPEGTRRCGSSHFFLSSRRSLRYLQGLEKKDSSYNFSGKGWTRFYEKLRSIISWDSIVFSDAPPTYIYFITAVRLALKWAAHQHSQHSTQNNQLGKKLLVGGTPINVDVRNCTTRFVTAWLNFTQTNLSSMGAPQVHTHSHWTISVSRVKCIDAAADRCL